MTHDTDHYHLILLNAGLSQEEAQKVIADYERDMQREFAKRIEKPAKPEETA